MRSRPTSWRWSTASRAGCGQPGGYVARSCSGSASATSRERPGRARCRRRQTQTILATARELLATAASLIESKGITLVGVALSNLDDEGAI